MFNSSHIGISISDEAINFVELKKSGGEFELGKFGEKRLPKGVIEDGVIKDPEEVIGILRLFREKKEIKSALVALPEEEENLFVDYLADYKDVFKNASVRVKSFEPEGIAISRAVIKKGYNGTCMLLNIGRSHTDIFIVSNGMIALTSIINVGGDTIIKITKGEGMKKELGLNRSMIVAEVSSATVSGISILREEISRHLMYWNTRKNDEGERRATVEKIILSGCDASMKGLDEFLSVSFKIKVELADVWVNTPSIKENIPQMTFKESLSYAPAFGMALRGFE